LQEIANSKKLASNTIAYNIYNKEYDANRNALNQKLQGLPENDKANFSNSLSQIESDYQKAVTYKESAFSKSNLKEFFGLFGKKKPQTLQSIIDADPIMRKLDNEMEDIAKTFIPRIKKIKDTQPELFKKMQDLGIIDKDFK
jgi:hypothetical protein